MNTAIMLSFVIPAIVATVLTGMLIKEKDHLLPRKDVLPTQEAEKQEKYRSPDDYRNDLNRIDFSGGLLGI
ncbi:MAG: hypothetical protein ACJ77K_10165 [Bacteroidia bacterium]